MIFRLVRYGLSLIGFLAVITVVGSVAAAALVLAGGAELAGCRRLADGEVVPVQRSAGLADQFQAKLDAFVAALDAGSAASVSFTSDETSSRIAAHLEEQDVAVEDVVVCFEPGGARVSGRFADLLGRDLSLQVEGSLDLTGAQPRLALTSIKAGKLPMVGPMRGLVTDRINEALTEIELQHRFALTFGYGVATLSAQPGRP